MPPRTPLEEVVADLWAEALDLDEVGIHDDFFARGGHSLLAARLVARLHQVFRVDLPLRVLFRRPTVAGIAEVAAGRPGGTYGRVERIAELLIAPEDDEELPVSLTTEVTDVDVAGRA